MKVLVIRNSIINLRRTFDTIIDQQKRNGNRITEYCITSLRLTFENVDEYHGHVVTGNRYEQLMGISRDYDNVYTYGDFPIGTNSNLDYYIHIRPLTNSRNREQYERNIREFSAMYNAGVPILDSHTTTKNISKSDRKEPEVEITPVRKLVFD